MPGIRKTSAAKAAARQRAAQIVSASRAATQKAERDAERRPQSEVEEGALDWRARLATIRDQKAQTGQRLGAMIETLEEVCERQENTDDRFARVDANYNELLSVVNGMAEELDELNVEEDELEGGPIARSATPAVGTERTAGPIPPASKFRLGTAVAGWLNGWEDEYKDVPERAMIEAALRRAGMSEGIIRRSLQYSQSSSGGLLIAAQLLGEWITALRPRTVAGALGARFRPFTGPVSMRRTVNGSSSYWTGEGKKATKSSLGTGQISLTPKPLVTVVPISDSILRYGPDQLQGDIENDMSLGQGAALDLAVLVGSGGVGEPMGLKNLAGGTTSFASIDYLGADQNVTDLIEAIAAAPATRNVQGRVGGAMHPSALLKLRSSKDAQGRTLLKIEEDSPEVESWISTGKIHNLRYATTTALAYGNPTDLIVAAWAEVIVASFGVAELYPSRDATDTVTGDSAFMQGETWLRLRTDWDTGLRYTEAVQAATGWSN